MTWFRLCDQGAFHAKVLAAGNEAYGAWCRAGQWCSQQLTDGRLSRAVAVTIGPWRLWGKLIDAGLVEDLGKGELQIHDFLVYNPSAEEVLAERARKAGNVAAYRGRKSPPVTAPVTAPVTGYTIGNEPDRNHGPDPVPDPIPKEEQQQQAAGLTGKTAQILEKAIRAHRLFDVLGAREIAQSHAEWMVNKPQATDHVLTAIEDCAAKSVGQGMNARELQARLVGWMRNARRPREDMATRVARQAQEAAQHDGPIRPPKPPKEPQGPPASVERMLAASEMIAKIGKGAA